MTSLASLFPVEEAQKATKRVQDAIAEKHGELDRVRGFVADNNNLVNLVQKLPEELAHDIMVSNLFLFFIFCFPSENSSKLGEWVFQVPFGKAAFVPGRLVHTNEFLVLKLRVYFLASIVALLD